MLGSGLGLVRFGDRKGGHSMRMCPMLKDNLGGLGTALERCMWMIYFVCFGGRRLIGNISVSAGEALTPDLDKC